MSILQKINFKILSFPRKGTDSAVKSFSIYFLTTIVSKGFYFLSFILFSHYLSREDLGYLSLYNNSITFLTAFVSWGIIYNLNTNFFRQSPSLFGSNFKSLLFLPLVNVVFLVILLFITFDFSSKKFGFTSSFLWMIPLSLLFSFFYDLGLNVLRNRMMQKGYAIMSILKLLVEIALAALLIITFNQGWEGRVISIIVSFLIPAVIFIILFRNWGYLSGSINLRYWKDELFSFGPILLMQISIFMLNASDKFFLNYFHGPSLTGTFSVATNFSSVLVVVSSAVHLTIIPPLYKKLSENRNVDSIKAGFSQYLFFHVAFLIAVGVFIWITYTFLLDKTYYDTINYAYISLIGFFCWTLSNFYLSILLYFKFFRLIFCISAFLIFITYMMNYILIKEYSLLGASFSIVICNFLMLLVLLVSYYLNNKYGHIAQRLNVERD